MSTQAVVPLPCALEGVRVLDLSRRYGYYTGKLFADMGADVILIEPPGGCELRSEGPFMLDRKDKQGSIPFNFFNTSKRGVTLDLDTSEGLARLHKLAARADLVIEDAMPGSQARYGFDYASLAAIRPELVVTSITAFGQTGPYANDCANDLTLLAMGGFLNMMGYPERAPTQTYGEQAVAIGCMFAGVGAMLALLAAQTERRGQHVDVSIQECVTMATENASQAFDLEGRVRSRFGDIQRHAGTGAFACSDGYIYLFAGGMGAARFWVNLVRWLRDENVVGSEILTEPEWRNPPYLDTPEAKNIFNQIFPLFCANKSKAYLYHEGQRRNVPLCPINNVADVINNEQLRYRNMFVNVWHDCIGQNVLMPGAPFKMSESPGRISRRAPELGEHNVELFGSVAGEHA